MSGIFDEFCDSITGEVLTFNPDAMPAPTMLHIRMTRGERHIADELRKAFGGFERVVIDVDGEHHEFGADSLIRLLEGYEGASRYHELFGTPERAARTTVALNNCRVVCCEDCAARGACRYDGCGDDYDALLEWLRGERDVR